MSIHDIFVIVVGLICIWVLISYFIEIRKVRKLYAELKEDQQKIRYRQVEWIRDVVRAAADPDVSKDEMIEGLKDFYHELNGDAILKQMKK